MSCAPKRQLKQTQSIDRVIVTDTATMIRYKIVELLVHDTTHHTFSDTTHTIIRTVSFRETVRDTSASASLSLRSDSASSRSEIITTSPLTGQSNKGVEQGFAPASIWLLLILIGFFSAWYYYVKKK